MYKNKIIRFDSFNENNMEMSISGLKCDNPNCDYQDMSVPFEDYEKSINKPCPECGESLLTQEDYDNVVKMVDAMDIVNSFSESDLDKLVGNLSEDEINAALDMMNKLKMKKDGEDDDGREVWSVGESKKQKSYILVSMKETDGDISIENLSSDKIKKKVKSLDHSDYAIIDGNILKSFNSNSFDLNKL